MRVAGAPLVILVLRWTQGNAVSYAEPLGVYKWCCALLMQCNVILLCYVATMCAVLGPLHDESVSAEGGCHPSVLCSGRQPTVCALLLADESNKPIVILALTGALLKCVVCGVYVAWNGFALGVLMGRPQLLPPIPTGQ